MAGELPHIVVNHNKHTNMVYT